jgi:hypothetical protein
MRLRIGAGAAGLTVAAVAIALAPRVLVGVAGDDGTYLALAKSLAEGQGYRFAFLPGAPAAHLAPLYPAFLGMLWALWPAFPDNLTLLRFVNPVLLGLFAGGFAGYLAWRRVLPVSAAAVAAVVFATALPLLSEATVLLAGPLLLVLAVAAWGLADGSAGTDAGRRATLLAAGAGLAAGLAALTGSVGAGAVFAVVVALASRRRTRDALVAAACSALVLAPWMAWSALHRGVEPVLAASYGGYGALVRQAGLGALSLAALWEVLRPLGQIAFATLKDAYHGYAGVPAVAVLVVGAVTLARRAPALGWTLPGTLAVLLAWPHVPVRLVWVLVPVLGVAMLVGAVALWRAAGVGGRSRRLALRGLMLAGVLPAAAGFGGLQARGLFTGAATAGQRTASAIFDRVVPWVRSETPESAVIAGENEALVWLYTGRQTAPSDLWHLVGRRPVSYGPDSLRAYFGRVGVTHVLVTDPRSEATSVVDEAGRIFPGYLTIVRVWPGAVEALVVDPTAPPPAPPPSPADGVPGAPRGGGHPPGVR